jgi:tetratricopeptide (TPR) repeat protein
MLYHAYQFLDQASLCYRIARELDPGEYRFIYYGARAEKARFQYEESESLFLRALEMRKDDAELWAELGELYLMWGRPQEADRALGRALELDPLQPVAALGRARLLSLDQDWESVIDTLTPLLERYPRLSKAHQYVAAAYGALGMEKERAFHQEAGEYGSAVESPLVQELHTLAVPAILDGDPARGPELLEAKCARCHTHQRIYDHDEDRLWWARTVRRMQREAGWPWLTDDEAAAVVAYLSSRAGG